MLAGIGRMGTIIRRAVRTSGRRYGGSVADETYDPRRIDELKATLRELAERIIVLDAEDRLLEEVPALLERLGTVRAELFRYEVRTTFDSPETAENRRIVEQASQGWTPDQDEDSDASEEDDEWPPASP